MFRLFIWSRLHQNFVRSTTAVISIINIAIALQLAGNLQVFAITKIWPVLIGLLAGLLFIQWLIGKKLLVNNSSMKRSKFSLRRLYWMKAFILAKGLAAVTSLVLCFYILLPSNVPATLAVQGSKTSVPEIQSLINPHHQHQSVTAFKEDKELRKALTPIRIQTAFLIIGVVVLLIGAAAAACGAACSGNEALAVIVVVFGLGAGIFLLTHFLKKLNEKKRRIRAMSPEELKEYNRSKK